MAGDKNDKTQMLSESQVVEVKPQPPRTPAAGSPRPSADKNDRSMWLGTVVGADEFAPQPAPKSKAPRYVIAGVLGAGAIGGGAYYLWPASTNPVKQIDAAKPADAAPPPDAPRADAAIDARPPADAAPADAPADADVPDAMPADAGVPPVKKKPPVVKKKPPPKKPPLLKKKPGR